MESGQADTHSNVFMVSNKVFSCNTSIFVFIPTSNLINVYKAIVEPYFDYCSIVWDNISDHLTDKLQKLQNRAARVITGADYRMPIDILLSRLDWSNHKERRNKQKALMMFRIVNGMTPTCLTDIFSSNVWRSVYNLRTSRHNLALPVIKRTITGRVLLIKGQRSGMPYQKK